MKVTREGERSTNFTSLGVVGLIVFSFSIFTGINQKEIKTSPTVNSSDYLDPKSYKIRPDNPKEIIRKARSTEPFKKGEINPDNFLTKYPRSLY